MGGFFNRFDATKQSIRATDLEVDSPTVVVDEDNNRLGIGDAAPGTSVQVTDASPAITLKNSTAENTEGGCEGRILFEDHANVALAQIEGSHSGSSDDTKGKFIISTHTGSSLTTAVTIDDAQKTTFAGDVAVNNQFAAAGASGTFGTFGSSDGTPSVATGNLWKTHASEQTLTMFDDGIAGQTITVISTAAVTFDVTSTNLKGGSADIVTASGDITSWTYDGTNWYLQQFMDVSSNMATVGDVSEVVAGTLLDGGGASGSVTLNVDLTESAAATIAAGDNVLFLDGGATGTHSKGSINDVATLFAGTAASTGLSASSGVMSVTDLHPVGVDGSANQLLTDDGDGTVTSESKLTFDGSTFLVNTDVTATTNHTTVGAHIDYDATGIIASGQTGQNVGLDLDINSDSPTMVGTVLNTGIDVDLTGGTSGTQTNIGLDIYASGADQNFGAIITGTTADLILGTAGNADLTVLTARDQTAGTTAGKNLSISAGSGVTGGSDNINGGDLILSTGKGDGTGTASMQFRTKVSGTDDVAERVRIHTDGNVGIGDNAPGTMLQIKGANAYVTLQNETAENSDGGCETRLIFEDHGNNALGQIEISHVGSSDDEKGKMVFSTNNDSGLQAALTISEAQNVALAGDLQVSGNNIVDNGGSAGISFDGSGNTQVDGDLTVNGGDLQYSNGQNATMSIAAVSGTNTAGKSLTISGGQSTGNADGGAIVFKSSAAGASGSSANSLATVFTIENDGDIVVPGDIEMTDGSAIVDTNNSKLLHFCSVSSAVNYVEVENAADGTAPAISVLGDSTNITMSLKPKGTGGVRIFGSTAAAASLLLNEDSDNGTNFMKFQAAANIASNHTYTFPDSPPGSDRVLQSDSSGNLSWVESSGTAADDVNLILHMQVFS